jgi:thioredoxin-related protein
VFTTPYCASCGPVKASLAEVDPAAEIVTVDATREPHLADAFAVRSAPTVLLADRAGEVQARLVGAPAVRNYLSARTA